jgi:hypothetical protein
MDIVHAQHSTPHELPLHTEVDLQRRRRLVVGREDGLTLVADGERIANERGIGDGCTIERLLIVLLKGDQIRRALAQRLRAERGEGDAVDAGDVSVGGSALSCCHRTPWYQ